MRKKMSGTLTKDPIQRDRFEWRRLKSILFSAFFVFGFTYSAFPEQVSSQGTDDDSGFCRRAIIGFVRFERDPYGVWLRPSRDKLNSEDLPFVRALRVSNGDLRLWVSRQMDRPESVALPSTLGSHLKSLAIRSLGLLGRDEFVGLALSGALKTNEMVRWQYPQPDNLAQFDLSSWGVTPINETYDLNQIKFTDRGRLPMGGLSVAADVSSFVRPYFLAASGLEPIGFVFDKGMTGGPLSRFRPGGVRLERRVPSYLNRSPHSNSAHFNSEIRVAEDGSVVAMTAGDHSVRTTYLLNDRNGIPSGTLSPMRHPISGKRFGKKGGRPELYTMHGEAISDPMLPTVLPLEKGMAVMVTRDHHLHAWTDEIPAWFMNETARKKIEVPIKRPLGEVVVFDTKKLGPLGRYLARVDRAFKGERDPNVLLTQMFLDRINASYDDILKKLNSEISLAVSPSGLFFVTPELAFIRRNHSSDTDFSVETLSIHALLSNAGYYPLRSRPLWVSRSGIALIVAGKYEQSVQAPTNDRKFTIELAKLKESPMTTIFDSIPSHVALFAINLESGQLSKPFSLPEESPGISWKLSHVDFRPDQMLATFTGSNDGTWFVLDLRRWLESQNF